MSQVDLVVEIGKNGCAGDLVINGLHLRRLILQDREDFELLVRRLQMEYGTDIGIHLKIAAVAQMDEALVLAQKLSRLGATIGLSGSSGIAQTGSSGYNDGGADRNDEPRPLRH